MPKTISGPRSARAESADGWSLHGVGRETTIEGFGRGVCGEV